MSVARFLQIFLLAALLAVPLTAHGAWGADESLEDLLTGLTYDDPKPAIKALAASQDEKAKAAAAALAKGALFVRLEDNAVVIGEKDGDQYVVTNALTGDIEAMAAPDELKPIVLDAESKALLGANAGAAPVDAGPFDFATGVNALKADDFEAKGKAIDRLTELADPRAIPVFRALADGRLFIRKSDGALVIGDASGNDVRLTLATTLEPAGIVAPGDLDVVFVNNNLRSVLRESVGRLGLLSDDAATRRRAANALLDGITPDAVALLRKAWEKETDGGVKQAMALALAAADVTDPDKAKRLLAVGVLSGSTDLRVRSLLQARLGQEQDPDVKAAITKAFDSMQTKIKLLGYAENLVQGISLGSVLLLAAVGLAITFGVMGIINMAHGEMIMLGAYSAYVTQEFFRSFLPPSWLGAYLIVALPVAFLVAGCIGIIIERGVIRFLYGRPLETLLATFGVSLVLQQAVRTIFSPLNRSVATPEWMSGSIEINAVFALTWNRLTIMLFMLVVFALLMAVLRYTRLGLEVRAVAQNRAMARAIGVRGNRVDALTFGLGSGIAGVAGVALSQLTNVGPNLGQAYIVDSFMVVVFGGVGNLWGTLLAGLGLGVANKFLEPWAGAVMAKILVLVFIIVFIQKRPRGLFPQRGRAAEG